LQQVEPPHAFRGQPAAGLDVARKVVRRSVVGHGVSTVASSPDGYAVR
jgi:hypothetical protein